jgi:hypothetical protein
VIFLISASRVARITYVSNHTWPHWLSLLGSGFISLLPCSEINARPYCHENKLTVFKMALNLGGVLHCPTGKPVCI